MEHKPTAVVRVHRPDLTPEELAQRMASIEQAAARLVLAARKVNPGRLAQFNK